MHGSETQKIAGTGAVREFDEEKSMQKVTTQETTLTFRGDIREFDIKDNKAVSALDVRKAPKLEVLYCAGNGISELDLTQNKKLKRLQCYKETLIKGLTPFNSVSVMPRKLLKSFP